ncbi:recombinase family protein [Campylobacter coli]
MIKIDKETYHCKGDKYDLGCMTLFIYKYLIDSEWFTKNAKEWKRKIKDLKQKLKAGDLLIATELSRLGRSMLEIINLVLEFNSNNIKFLFLRQMELSNFNNPASKLILSVYAYLAENERDLISQRTKAGLENARASGKKLGRPKGSLNSIYDKDIDKIQTLLDKDLSIKSIWKLLYKDNGKSYDGLLWFIKKRKLKGS